MEVARSELFILFYLSSLKKAASKDLSDNVFLAIVTAGPVFRRPISRCMIGGLICKGEFKGEPSGPRPLLS